MTRTLGAFLLVALLLTAATASAQGHSGTDGGLLVRIDGTVTIGPNDTVATLILLGDESRAIIDGHAGVVIIIGGTLALNGTIGEQLVLVNAHGTLHNGSHVRGDIALSTSTLDQEEGAVVDGMIEEGATFRIGPALALAFGLIFLVGIPVAFIIGGLVAMALFPHQVRTVGTTFSRDLKGSTLTALLLWLALPLAAFVAMLTLVGIPTGLGVLLIVLPFLWVAGFVAIGIRLGDTLLTTGRTAKHGHPYAAAFVGIITLLVVGLLPFIGGLIVFLAGAVGSGALVLAGWRAARSGGRFLPVREKRERPWDPGAGGA